MRLSARDSIEQLRDGSLRALRESERIVEQGFNEARLRATLAAALVLLGFLLVAQMRGTATESSALENQSAEDLAAIMQETDMRNDQLEAEAGRLEARISSTEDDRSGRERTFNQAAAELASVRAAAGLEAVEGPGVVVTLSYPAGGLAAADMIELVHELRAAGAEAVAVDGIRLMESSWFGSEQEEISLSGKKLDRMLDIEAIGDAATMEQALSMPGGIIGTLAAYPGVSASVRTVRRVGLPSAE